MTLNTSYTLLLISTKGKPGTPDAYFDSYTLECSPDAVNFVNVTMPGSDEPHEFTGNSDGTSVVSHDLTQFDLPECMAVKLNAMDPNGIFGALKWEFNVGK